MAQSNAISVFQGRKEERLNSGISDQISSSAFNAVMCATLFWGFLVNALMIGFWAEPIYNFLSGISPWVTFGGYFVLSIIGILLSVKSDKPAISFLGFNLLVLPIGVMLCLLVPWMPIAIVNKALILTGLVTATMILLGLIRPQLFLGLGRTLFIALIVGILAEVLATFVFHYTGAAFDWLFVIIFSAYIGYDIAKAQVYPKTVDNAIDCALDLYLDIVYLFIRLLSLLARES